MSILVRISALRTRNVLVFSTEKKICKIQPMIIKTKYVLRNGRMILVFLPVAWCIIVVAVRFQYHVIQRLTQMYKD